MTERWTLLVENGGHNLFEAHPDFPAIMTAYFKGLPPTVRRLTLPPPTVPAP
jgi:hypothetical protein